MIIPVRCGTPEQKIHEGYEWMYVLDGRLRLLLGDQDLMLTEGEAAEFDFRAPHWFDNAAPHRSRYSACSAAKANAPTSAPAPYRDSGRGHDCRGSGTES